MGKGRMGLKMEVKLISSPKKERPGRVGNESRYFWGWERLASEGEVELEVGERRERRTYTHRGVNTVFEYVGSAIRVEVLVETVFAVRTEGLVLVLLEGFLEVAVVWSEYGKESGEEITDRQGTRAMLSL